jgi:hypothetical protein
MRASHIKTFRGHGSFISSNLVDETHVPRNAPGTPQANARFRPARAHARSADESQESAGDCAQGAGSGRSRSEAGLGQQQGGLGGREALEGESSVGRGRSKGWGESQGGLGQRAGWRARRDREVPDKQNAPLAPGRSGRPCGTVPIPWEGPPAPRGTNDAIRPAPPPSQKCRGRSAGTPFLHGVRITRELRRARN